MSKFLWLIFGLVLGVVTCTQAFEPTTKFREEELPLPYPELKSVLYGDEVKCVARVVYGEARGESVRGQALVAISVISRVLDGRWSFDACDVAKQPGQFAGYHAAKLVKEPKAYAKALAITNSVGLFFFYAAPELQEIRYFDSNKHPSKFHSRLKVVQTEGAHRFYTDKEKSSG